MSGRGFIHLVVLVKMYVTKIAVTNLLEIETSSGILKTHKKRNTEEKQKVNANMST